MPRAAECKKITLRSITLHLSTCANSNASELRHSTKPQSCPSNEQCMAILVGNLVTYVRFQDQAPLCTWLGMHWGLLVGCL